MSTPPKWFRPVAVLALIWNLIGCAAYLSDVTLKPADVAKMSAAQQGLYAARPTWAIASTAVAVWFGAAGCLGLVLRRRWSLPLLVASLAGLIVQDTALFGVVGLARVGGAAVVLQGLVLLIAIGLILLARRAMRLGWLS